MAFKPILVDEHHAFAGDAKTLAVVLHGWSESRDKIDGLIETVKAVFADRGGVRIYAPAMRYANWWDFAGANRIVAEIIKGLDDLWAREGAKFERVVFIGHGIGGTLLRRVFLAGAPHPDDYSGDFAFRDDLPENVRGPRPWAAKVERLVLLATWDKGWSLSDRMAPGYWWKLGLLGLWGRVVELVEDLDALEHWRKFREKFLPGLHKYCRTLLDMRRGAPFVVQTRLLWMAYRRWRNEDCRKTYNAVELARAKGAARVELKAPSADAADPLVIQIIGSQDDRVSPQDQVDCDVEGPLGKSAPKFFLLEMIGADHDSIVEFENDSQKALLREALLCGSDGPAHKVDPTLFLDAVPQPEPDVTDVVFVMHGIRDDGYWTHRIAKAVKEFATAHAPATQKFATYTSTYGYFPMGAFILPWLRQEKVEWFMDAYVAAKGRYPVATLHYVGHSNGTYIAAKALEDYSAARFGRIYFAGSVVHPRTDVARYVAEGRIGQLHNVPGANDAVVALLPKSVEYFSDLGGVGWDGFASLKPSPLPPQITESAGYAKGGHGAAITEAHWGEIAKFIVTGEKPFAGGEPAHLFDGERDPTLKLAARLRVGIPAAFSIAALIVLLGVSIWLPFVIASWGAHDFFGGWGFIIWLLALASFLALQYFTDTTPTPTNPLGRAWLWLMAKFPKLDAIRSWSRAWGLASFALMAFCALGVANWFFTSLFSVYEGIAKFPHGTAFHATAATWSLAVMAVAIRFVLMRF